MSAWDEFDACVRAARAIVRDEDAARDIATEVCAADLPPSFKRSTYAHWRALDYVKRERLEVVTGYDVELAPAATPTPEEELIAKQERASLLALLGTEAMYVLENPLGLDDDELGARIGKSPEAVRQIRSRARRKLIEVE